MHERWVAISRALARHPQRALAVVLAVVVIFGFLARDVRLDNNFAALFATDSTEARFREHHREVWGPDDGLLVAVVHTADPADEQLIALIDRISTETAGSIAALDHVNSVTNTEIMGRSPDGTPLIGPAFGPTSPFTGTTPERVDLARASDLGAANLLADDGRTFLVVGELKGEYDSYESVVGPAEDFRATVEAIARSSGLPVETHFSGVAYTRIAAIQQMQLDLLKLSPLATLFMAIILYAVFRRWTAVVAPVLAIGASIVVTAGVIGLAGDDINQVTIIFPILLMGVVVSSSAHLVHRYYRERALGLSAEDAGRVVIEKVTRGALLAALTTAIGFISLVIAQMQILHEFGLYLAIGVMAAFVIQCVVVPCVLIWSGSEPSAAYLRSADGRASGSRTERYARWVSRPRVAASVVVIGLVVAIVSIHIARTAVYDYALSKSLSEDDPVSQGNEVIDRELSGIIPIEIALQGQPGDFRDPDVLRRVATLSEWLRANYGVRPMSLSHLVEEASVALGGPRTIPDEATTAQVLQFADGYRGGDYLRSLVRDDFATSRLRGYTPDHGGRAIGELKTRFEAEAQRVLTGTAVSAKLTGEAPVAYDGMNNLSRELIESTTLALVMISLALLLVFRNGWLALIGVLPNVIPVLVGLAVYRLTTDVLDPLPGVVFCVAMGLAADDTIHLINRWNELRATAPTNREALVEALVTVRKAMVSSSLTLVAAFLALALSSFVWNRQLGILGAFVLLLALGSDLLFGSAGLALLSWSKDRRRARLGRDHVVPAERRARERISV